MVDGGREIYVDAKVVEQEKKLVWSPADGECYDEGEEGLHEGL